MPKISLGTVYRNLELLVANNLARKLEVSGSEARFDGQTEPHYHVRCSRCGRVDDVLIHPKPKLPRRFENSSGYEIQSCRMEFIGLCPDCRKLPESPGS